MMKYRIKIIETIAMAVEVEAPSKEEALAQMKKTYQGEEIVVESGARPDVEFIVSPID